ncbi:MAG: hypothetical protein FJ265_23070, partial [Planctomycetes bacterium]|nr:hypothetical protein [Planctomycetota bacterium]
MTPFARSTSPLPRPRPALAVASFALLLLAALPAQGTREDYERARTLPAKWQQLGKPFRPALRWLDDGTLWWRESRGGEIFFVRIGADGARRESKQAADLGLPGGPTLLEPRREGARSTNSADETSITFENRLDRKVRVFWIDTAGEPKPYGELAPGQSREQHTFAGHAWLCDFGPNDLAGVFVAEPWAGRAVLDEKSVARARRGPRRERSERAEPPSPLFVRDGNVFLRGEGGDVALSTDGSAADPYHEPRHWSPDRCKVLGFQVTPPAPHPVTVVESTPKDQLQPKVHTFDYPKPGDAIARPRPRLFDMKAKRQIPVPEAPFAEPWSIDRVHWARDGREVYVLHNQR